MPTYRYLADPTFVAVTDDDGVQRQQTRADRVPEGATIVPYSPPTQAELDAALQAEITAMADQLDNGRSMLRSLGVEIYLLAKAADASLTPAKFKQRNIDRIKTF